MKESSRQFFSPRSGKRGEISLADSRQTFLPPPSFFFFLSDKESLEKEKVTRERETAFEHVLFVSLMRTLFVPWISNPWREFQANIYRKIFASTTYCKLKRKNIKRNTCFNNEKEKRKFENLRKSIPHFPFLLPNARSNHLSITFKISMM